MQAKYSLNDPFNKFALAHSQTDACVEAVDWVQNTNSVEMTFGQAMEELLRDEKVPQSWAVWCLVSFKDEFDKEVREKFMDKITDTMMAFCLYVDMPWLTDDEDIILESKFKDKLPSAEAELAQGIVERKKAEKVN